MKCSDTGAAIDYASGEPESGFVASQQNHYNGKTQSRDKFDNHSSSDRTFQKKPREVHQSDSLNPSAFQMSLLRYEYNPNDHEFG
jgi:hypothetical protein